MTLHQKVFVVLLVPALMFCGAALRSAFEFDDKEIVGNKKDYFEFCMGGHTYYKHKIYYGFATKLDSSGRPVKCDEGNDK